MLYLRNFLAVYAVLWIVFAVFDFKGMDTAVAYELRPTVDVPANYPKYMTLSPTVYRIQDQIVIGQTADFEPQRYTDCAVIDTDNWTCTYSDESGKFGFRDGDFYSVALRTNEPNENVSVSRFGYVLSKMKWFWISDGMIEKVMVLFVPFFV